MLLKRVAITPYKKLRDVYKYRGRNCHDGLYPNFCFAVTMRAIEHHKQKGVYIPQFELCGDQLDIENAAAFAKMPIAEAYESEIF